MSGIVWVCATLMIYLRTNSFRYFCTLVLGLLGSIILGGGIYGLGTAQREWPSIAEIDFNLEYGPLPPNAAVEQSLGNLPLPVTRVAVWVSEPISGSRAVIRILQTSNAGQTLVFEQVVHVEPSGRAAIAIPPHVTIRGSGFSIQLINPAGSPATIYVQANRVNGYPAGIASINGDIGNGGNDLVFQIWRRATPRTVMAALLGTSIDGLAFLAASCLVFAVGLVWISRWASYQVGGTTLDTVVLVILGSALIAWSILGVFRLLEPWKL